MICSSPWAPTLAAARAVAAEVVGVGEAVAAARGGPAVPAVDPKFAFGARAALGANLQHVGVSDELRLDDFEPGGQ